MSRGAETRQQASRRFVLRSAFVLVFFGLAATSLLARAVHLQVLNKDFLNQQADTRHLRTETISAHRGLITDRQGKPGGTQGSVGLDDEFDRVGVERCQADRLQLRGAARNGQRIGCL